MTKLVNQYNTGSDKIQNDLAPKKSRWITKRAHASWYDDDLRLAKRIKRRAQRIFWKTGLVVHKDVSTEAYIPAEFISFLRKKRKEKKIARLHDMTKNDEIKKETAFILEEVDVFLGDIDRSSVSGQIINKFHDQLRFLHVHRHSAVSRPLRLHQVGKLPFFSQ